MRKRGGLKKAVCRYVSTRDADKGVTGVVWAGLESMALVGADNADVRRCVRLRRESGCW